LLPPDVRKQYQTLKRLKNRCPHAKRRLRTVFMNIVGNRGEIPDRARRETELYRSKRRNAASISASVAN
jgi:hypothetical protein